MQPLTPELSRVLTTLTERKLLPPAPGPSVSEVNLNTNPAVFY